MKAFSENILQEELISAVAVHGGDINNSYRLETKDNVYFLKLNDAAKFPGMFEKEAAGLKVLKETGKMAVPAVIKYGLWQEQQFLLLKWIESAALQNHFWPAFGQALANMHRQTAEYFGWGEDNYIGNQVQINTKKNDWHSFYVECRIMPLLQILAKAGKFSVEDFNAAGAFCNKIAGLFPEEPPALLHGDLWKGNIMSGETGNAIVFDSAVYYGHREMDIGMTRLFGGFPEAFYTAYMETYPLADGWEHRIHLTQLYPVLVHAVLFGGHYILQAKEIMQAELHQAGTMMQG
jgi:fructosamine-3-kinase